MEVFSDYECPSCRNLYENTLRPMISDYVASGKVYLVHRDFPLPMHKYGYEAARWVNAAARVGQFQNVEAALYDNQDAWAANGNIEKYVASSMPAAEFKRVQKLMTGCEYLAPGTIGQSCTFDTYINADHDLGMKIPVQATPTYVITYKGQKLPAGSGAVSWPILKQFFDSLLSQ
jgi:protein-disulfide isomerase